MRIVQVNVIYGHGSTGRIVESLHQEYLKQGHDAFVLYGRGQGQDGKRVFKTGYLWEAKLWRFIQLFTGNLLGGSPLSTSRLKRCIKKLNPDVVHLHCINGNMVNVYSLISWLRKRNIKTVITHHAMFLFSGGCGLIPCDGFERGCGNCPHKQQFFGNRCGDPTKKNVARLQKCGIAKLNHVFVSPWLEGLAKRSVVLKDAKTTSIFNPIDTDVFSPKGPKHVLDSGMKYVFFPSSLKGNAIKGAQFIDEIAKRLEPLKLCVAVTEGADESSHNVMDIGHISNPEEMAAWYRGAKATLVLSSVESFSMPVAESLCCGTPVVGFKCGGPESIETGGFGTFVKYGNIDALIEAIKATIENKKKPTASITVNYAEEETAKRYLKLFQGVTQ